MSKQQTFAPDDLETHRQKRSVKKVKPWNLWCRLKSRNQNLSRWWRFGRYETSALANEVMESDGRKKLYDAEYKVLHESAGKPT